MIRNTPARNEELIRRWRAGETAVQIAKAMGWAHAASVYNRTAALRREGINLDRRHADRFLNCHDPLLLEICHGLDQSGQSLEDAEAKSGLGARTISRWLSGHGKSPVLGNFVAVIGCLGGKVTVDWGNG